MDIDQFRSLFLQRSLSPYPCKGCDRKELCRNLDKYVNRKYPRMHVSCFEKDMYDSDHDQHKGIVLVLNMLTDKPGGGGGGRRGSPYSNYRYGGSL